MNKAPAHCRGALWCDPLWQRAIAEVLGTFALVSIGCGAAAVNAATDGAVSHAGVALAFGLVVFCVIETVGPICGAHLNPAVTIAFALDRRLAWRDVPVYVLAQCLGATVAAYGLLALLGEPAHAGVTRPNAAIGITQYGALAVEAAMTCGLMTTILAVATGPKEKGLLAGLSIGGVVAIEAMAFGPVCGASMNPARSLGPAIAATEFTDLWLYLVGPTVGAALAVPLYLLIRPLCADE
ncbi:MIP/aquaporin family protein [Alienimonas chondri]|uniref:Glycerol uptake facilitator protein n=1 Tax=Alienimonas chondri TaxID=2681879 RepID=A0ABX1VI07_9PLAN|nr:aquaporin [Alienimonas chondri]NNJ27495.1 Glycerol uptake facilitator protein [Alienimonas chondri]